MSLICGIEESFKLETEMINTVVTFNQRSTQPFDNSDDMYCSTEQNGKHNYDPYTVALLYHTYTLLQVPRKISQTNYQPRNHQRIISITSPPRVVIMDSTNDALLDKLSAIAYQPLRMLCTPLVAVLPQCRNI